MQDDSAVKTVWGNLGRTSKNQGPPQCIKDGAQPGAEVSKVNLKCAALVCSWLCTLTLKTRHELCDRQFIAFAKVLAKMTLARLRHVPVDRSDVHLHRLATDGLSLSKQLQGCLGNKLHCMGMFPMPDPQTGGWGSDDMWQGVD